MAGKSFGVRIKLDNVRDEIPFEIKNLFKLVNEHNCELAVPIILESQPFSNPMPQFQHHDTLSMADGCNCRGQIA